MYVVAPPPPPFSPIGAVLLCLAAAALIDLVGSLVTGHCFLFRCEDCKRNSN